MPSRDVKLANLLLDEKSDGVAAIRTLWLGDPGLAQAPGAPRELAGAPPGRCAVCAVVQQCRLAATCAVCHAWFLYWLADVGCNCCQAFRSAPRSAPLYGNSPCMPPEAFIEGVFYNNSDVWGAGLVAYQLINPQPCAHYCEQACGPY